MDELSIDPTLWEHLDLEKHTDFEKSETEIMTDGEDRVVETAESLETGEPLTPPDQLIPEE